MRLILRKIKVLQVVSNDLRHKNGLKRLGKGWSEAYRLNPYNPVSYIGILISIFLGLFIFGFYGVWKNLRNPFKWY